MLLLSSEREPTKHCAVRRSAPVKQWSRSGLRTAIVSQQLALDTVRCNALLLLAFAHTFSAATTDTTVTTTASTTTTTRSLSPFVTV
jgi:hypothetical protein